MNDRLVICARANFKKPVIHPCTCAVISVSTSSLLLLVTIQLVLLSQGQNNLRTVQVLRIR